MNEATLAALTALAAKLSTTVEYLWGVLLVQASLSAIIDLGIFIVIYLILAVWAFAIYKGSRKDPFKDSRYDNRYWGKETISTNLISIGGVTACITLVFSLNVGSIISKFVNPEYWALLQLASVIH